MKRGSKLQTLGTKEQRHLLMSSEQKVHKEEAGRRKVNHMSLLGPLGGMWVGRKDTFTKGCRGVLTLSGEVPVFDVFLALNYTHPVLAGPL